MKFLLPFAILTTCAAAPQDLSGQMFTFPQESNTAHVRLNTSRGAFKTVTVCLRSFTDLSREHSLFSMSTQSFTNEFLVFKKNALKAMSVYSRDQGVEFAEQDYKLNSWHSICSTWTSVTGLTQLWLDGRPSSRKYTKAGSNLDGNAVIILGQEQDTFGGGFHDKQSFVGMLSDVHMWDYVLSPCEIQRYVDDLNFTPGNVLNWRALEFQIRGKVLLENKQTGCYI